MTANEVAYWNLQETKRHNEQAEERMRAQSTNEAINAEVNQRKVALDEEYQPLRKAEGLASSLKNVTQALRNITGTVKDAADTEKSHATALSMAV